MYQLIQHQKPNQSISQSGGHTSIRSSLVAKRQLRLIDADKEVVKVSILDTMCMLVKSWDAITPSKVVICFRKAETSKGTHTANVEDIDDQFKLCAENL